MTKRGGIGAAAPAFGRRVDGVSRPRDKSPGPQTQRARSKRLNCWIALFVGVATFAVFFPALQNEFVDWDDYTLLINNTRYRGLGWEQLRWMFSTFHLGHYQPLSWMTFGMDYLLWDLKPFGYHLTNLVLHAANAVLFYFLTLRLLSLALSMPSAPAEFGLRAAAGFAALFFAIHPLRVESVAWATERRDVLSALFFLATLLCYVRAATVENAVSHRWRWLSAALIFYGLSLLSKASGITLPIVLFVLDVYPLRRLEWGPKKWSAPPARRLLWEKVPFLFLAAGAAAIALYAQSSKAMTSFDIHGLAPRLAQSFYGLGFYLCKTVLPINLSPLYEIPPRLNPLDWPFLLSGMVVVAVSLVLFFLRQRWPAGLTSWVYYVVIVAPVLGIAQSGLQLVADRYSYLACMAWSILVGGGLYCLWKRHVDRRLAGWKSVVITMGASALIIGLSVLTWKQAEVWHDTEKLWNHVVAITDKSTFRSAYAHHLKARFLANRGDLDGAIDHLHLSIEINPYYAPTYSDLGGLLARQGHLDDAIQNFHQALELEPTLSKAHFNLGNAFALQGNLGTAVQHLAEALRIKPDYVEAYNNLGKVLAAQGHLDEAIDLFRRALQIQPHFAEAHQSLGMALAEAGRRDEAVEHYQEAERIMKLRYRSEAPG